MKTQIHLGPLWLLISLLVMVFVSPLYAETLSVPFTGGAAAVTTSLSYSGTVWISVSGIGAVGATPPLNDAFFVYTDAAGSEVDPFYPDTPATSDSGLLWINGAPAQNSVPGWSGPPQYNPLHQYTIVVEVAPGPITFGVGDTNPLDNSGAYTIWIGSPAEVYFEPQTLNLRSRGRWVTVFIELPSGLNPRSIDRTSIRLNGLVAPAFRPWAVGDYDRDGVPDLMVKFSRAAVQPLLSAGDCEVTIDGNLSDGTSFLGATMVRVINPGRWRGRR